ncbi:MAG: class I SAM-dependent rRNA methyltransferase, partial [Porticoccaceae bacterium]
MLENLLRLKKGAERRLRAGHLWIYSNEVDTAATPLAALIPGAAVTVVDARGKALGAATVNPASLICARLYSRRADQALDAELLTRRLLRALSLRQQLYPESFYRLAYGDGDGLPGLVVDRFGDYLSVQLTTAGMDRRRDLVIEALIAVTGTRGIVLRNVGSFRHREHLPEAIEVIFGDVPEQVELVENGTRFIAPLLRGQKTGWFYD